MAEAEWPLTYSILVILILAEISTKNVFYAKNIILKINNQIDISANKMQT